MAKLSPAVPRSSRAAAHADTRTFGPTSSDSRAGSVAGFVANARYGHRFSQIAVSQPPIQSQMQAGEEMQRQTDGPAAVHADASPASTGGSALPTPIRSKMERSFGHSLADVRIHSGGEARQVGALAYTRGSDIHFQPGLYDSDSLGGQELLGHELTHVVQQRAGRVSVPQNKSAGAAPINADPGLEAEADALGARAARGESAPVSGAAGGGLQRKADVVQCKPGFLSRLIGRPEDGPQETPTMTDADVATYKQQKGETSGRVDRVGYNRPIGESGQKNGFFKPEWQPGNPLPAVMGNTVLDPANEEEHRPEAVANGLRLGSRAVASSRLDKALGTDVIAEEVFATHQGEGGSVSAAVPGRPVIEGNDYGSMHVNHDFARPETQKGLSDLQINHYISGQLDAHGGNMFIDPATGKVKGIDNDGAFLPGNVPMVGPVMNMPQQIDLETGRKILSMKAKNLGGILNGDNPTDKQLTPDEVAAAQDRLRGLKAHVKDLKRGHQLVGQTKYDENGREVRDADGNAVRSEWGQETYDVSVAAGKASRVEGGYVGRSVRDRDPNRLQDNEYREEDTRQREENFALPFAAVSNMNQAMRQFDKYDDYALPAPAPPPDAAMQQLITSRMNDPVFAPNSSPLEAAPAPSRPRSGAYGVPIAAPFLSDAPALGGPQGEAPAPEGRPRALSGPYGIPVPAPSLVDAPALGGPVAAPSVPRGRLGDRLRFFEELARGGH